LKYCFDIDKKEAFLFVKVDPPITKQIWFLLKLRGQITRSLVCGEQCARIVALKIFELGICVTAQKERVASDFGTSSGRLHQ